MLTMGEYDRKVVSSILFISQDDNVDRIPNTQHTMVNKSSRITAIIVLLLWACAYAAKAQVIQKGNTFIETTVPSKGNATKTDYLYTDSKGVTDTVYISRTGKAFVWKTSKKSGKKYRKYLPEVTKKLQQKSEKR